MADQPNPEVTALEKRLQDLAVVVEKQAEEISKSRNERAAIPPPVYVPRDRKVPVFYGFPGKSSDISYEEWAETVVSAFKTWHIPTGDQADAIMDFLGGQARTTVKLMDSLERGQINRVFAVLQSVYGDKVAVGKRLKEFYERSQYPNETVRSFAYDLQERMRNITRRDIKRVPCSNLSLNEQFVSGLRDDGIRRSVKMKLREIPEIGFTDLMQLAIDWSEEEESTAPVGSARPKSTMSAAIVSSETGDTQTKLMQELLQQQSEIISLLKQRQNTTKTSKPFRDEQGRILCFLCKNPGHVKKDCPSQKTQDF